MPQPREGSVRRVDEAHCTDARAGIPHPDARLVVALLILDRHKFGRVLRAAAPVDDGQWPAVRRLNGRRQVVVAAHFPTPGGHDEVAEAQPRRLGRVLAAKRRISVRKRNHKSPIGKQFDTERRAADLHRAARGADGAHCFDRQHTEQRQRDIGACVGAGAVRRDTALLFLRGQVGHRRNLQRGRRIRCVKRIRQRRRQPGNARPHQQQQKRQQCRQPQDFFIHTHPSLWDRMCDFPAIMTKTPPSADEGALVSVPAIFLCCRAAGRPQG